MTRALVSLAILLCAGCAQFSAVIGLGDNKLDTTNKALAAAALEIDGVALLTTRLLEGDVITVEQAQRVASVLQTALDTVEVAQASIASTRDPTEGESAVSTAKSAIALALSLLTQFAPGETPAIYEVPNGFVSPLTLART